MDFEPPLQLPQSQWAAIEAAYATRPRAYHNSIASTKSCGIPPTSLLALVAISSDENCEDQATEAHLAAYQT